MGQRPVAAFTKTESQCARIDGSGGPPTVTLPQLLAIAAGNGLQFYDFLVYAFFATQIGETFFPSRDRTASLLASLATFGVGYLARPIGAVVVGVMGDRVGRKPAMILSFALMGVGILGLSVTPSYAQIGLAAPLLAIVFRLVQGFALGGEVGPSTTLLIEIAPKTHRGRYVSLQYATQDASILAAGVVGMCLAHWLDASQLARWGWRLAFALGAAIVPFGLLLRQRVPETLAPVGGARLAAEPQQGARAGRIGRTLVLLCASMICFVTLNYLTTYAVHTLRLMATPAFAATVVIGLVGVCCDLLGGWLTDRFGRKRVMMIPWAILLAGTVLLFDYMIRAHTIFSLLATSALLALLVDISTTSVLVSVCELMPHASRSASIGTLYAISATIFGGTTQFVVTWLIAKTGSPLAPAWYMSGAIAAGLLAMWGLPETAPSRTQANPVRTDS
ncbi:MAG TPA: MFS transporter [Steroidobacteraceae bacterium]